MFTRFRTATAVHVFDAPLIKIPPHVIGAPFLSVRGETYECEEELNRQWLIRNANDLRATLERAEFHAQPGVAEFLAGLNSLITFLHEIAEDHVALYSYDRTPTIHDILDAFQEPGANDWALEEVGKQGGKGRKALLSVLKHEKSLHRSLAAVSMLLIHFQDEKTIAAIQKWIDASDSEAAREGALLLAAYRAN